MSRQKQFNIEMEKREKGATLKRIDQGAQEGDWPWGLREETDYSRKYLNSRDNVAYSILNPKTPQNWLFCTIPKKPWQRNIDQRSILLHRNAKSRN